MIPLHIFLHTMRPKKIKQRIVTKIPILGGKAFIYRSTRSGKIYQYQQWISGEKRYIRISLHTSEYDIAVERAENKFAETLGQIHAGEKIFSITAGDFVEEYLKHLQERVTKGYIRQTYLQSVRCHLRKYTDFIGKDTKIQNIKSDKWLEFADYRRAQKPQPQWLNIKNTQVAISTMMKFGIENHFITQKYIPKWSEFRIPAKEGKRLGIEIEQYRKIVSISKEWHKNAASDRERYEREMLHHFIRLQSWYGFRTGEVRGLLWKDVKFRENGIEAEVQIRESTTKRDKGRMCRGKAEFFKKVLATVNYTHTAATDYVFSGFQTGKQIGHKIFYARWRELVRLIKAAHPSLDWNKLSLYDLRHFWITSQLNAGTSARNVAHYCGTSELMLVRHYDNVKDAQVSSKILSKTLKFVGGDVIGVSNKNRKDGGDDE